MIDADDFRWRQCIEVKSSGAKYLVDTSDLLVLDGWIGFNPALAGEPFSEWDDETDFHRRWERSERGR